MSISLPNITSRPCSRSGQLWPINETVNANESSDTSQDGVVKLNSTFPGSTIVESPTPTPSAFSSNALQCCKDDDNRKGTCCRDLKPSDQRTLISPDVIRDIVIGLSDGLTVPFALTAGISSLGSSRFVVLAGVAELISGAISMGVGGYFSTKAEIDNYHFHAQKIHQRVQKSCLKELNDEIVDILEPYGVSCSISTSISALLWQVEQTYQPDHRPVSTQSMIKSLFRKSHVESTTKKGLTSFLVQVGNGLEPVSPSRAYISAITIGFSYLAGGLVPLLPYIIIKTVRTALFVSIGITVGLLVVFGVVKQHYSGAQTGIKGYTYGAISTLLVGSMAAAASYGIVHAIESHQSIK